MSSLNSTEPLTLWPLSGPQIAPVKVAVDREAVLGRSSECDAKLEDPTASRRHAAVWHRGGRWFVKDLGSRHGTLVNGTRLNPEDPTPLRAGDHVTIGPWTFRVQIGARDGGSTIASVDDTGGSAQIRSVDARALTASRLRLIMDSAEGLTAAADETELAKRVTSIVVEGSAFSRAALVREVDGFARVELLATAKRGGGEAGAMPISRSLLSAARAGEVVQLESSPDLRRAVSIVGSGVQQAICAPVLVGQAVDAFLYADCDEQASGSDPEGASFVGALARICGLALSGLRRLALEREQRDLMRELTGAREVQRRMMPPARGMAGPLRFAFANMPGRVVAGDIGGVADLGDGRAALFIGDVTGKGLGPSLLMASTQAFLRAALATSDDPAKLVGSVNDYMVTSSAENEFASLWFALAGPGPRLRCVDAGHGLALLVRRGEGVKPVRVDGGVLIGVSPGISYGSTELTLAPGDRLVLFSDGIKEQRGAGGEEFGVERACKVLTGTGACERDVEALFNAVREFAGGDSFADDVTVASFELAP